MSSDSISHLPIVSQLTQPFEVIVFLDLVLHELEQYIPSVDVQYNQRLQTHTQLVMKM